MRVWPATQAGRKLAAPVPDVQMRATGCCSFLAIPSAKKAAERSYTCIQLRIVVTEANAMGSGVESDPGQITALWASAR